MQEENGKSEVFEKIILKARMELRERDEEKRYSMPKNIHRADDIRWQWTLKNRQLLLKAVTYKRLIIIDLKDS